MPTSLMSLFAVALLACGSPKPSLPTPSTGGDPTKHTVRLVEVAPGVSLEVIDHGGRGDALIFLAGLGNTGHVFDDFAPAFTGAHHVYAITRRGYGDSSGPATGYDVPTRIADDLAVLDKLGLKRAILAGHSIAGDELTGLAGQHPERVAAVIYIDAAFDQPEGDKVRANLPPHPGMAEPPPSSRKTPAMLHAAFKEQTGLDVPMGEIYAQANFFADARPTTWKERPDAAAMIIKGVAPVDYSRIQCPALVLYNRPSGPEQSFGNAWAKMDDATRAAWTNDGYPALEGWAVRERERVRANLRGAEIIEYPASNHYLFFDKRDELVRDIRAFLAKL